MIAAGAGTKPDRADVVIVGAGVGGALASLMLARAGLRVVCLEQGGWTRPEDHPHFHPTGSGSARRAGAPRRTSRLAPGLPVDSSDEHDADVERESAARRPSIPPPGPVSAPPISARARSTGHSPTGHSPTKTWRPGTSTHDQLVGVSGLLGDPAMPPARSVPDPAAAAGPARPVVAAGFERLGWHWWPMPCAIIAEDYDGRPACNNCGNCQSGCPRGSINDYRITIWPKAIAAGAELRPYRRVERIETGPDGRATGAVYVDRLTGLRFQQDADVVIVAANGVGTPRLLLLSESSRFPHGLANSSDQVGRNLMHHGLAIVEIWTRSGPTPIKGSSPPSSSARSSPRPIRRGASSTASRCTSPA